MKYYKIKTKFKKLLVNSFFLCTLVVTTACGGHESKKEEITLSDLSLGGELVKNEYYVGDVFSPEGLTVTASYSDKTTKNVTQSVVWPTTGLTIDDTFVYGSYTEGTITKSVKVEGLKVYPAKEMVSGAMALSKLSESAFKNYIDTDTDLGLSDISEVGVDEDKLSNEELYPVPATFDHIYKESDIGLSDTSETNSGTLNNFIASLRDVKGTKCIKLENKTYHFYGTIDFSMIDDLYIVGEKDTLILLHSWGSYINASACKNLHINNIQFDMAVSPTVSGVIESFKEEADYTDVTLKCPDEFDLSDKLYRSFDAFAANGQCSYMECYKDSDTGRYVPDTSHNLYYNTSTSNKDYFGVLKTSIQDNNLTVRIRKKFVWNAYHTPVIGTHVSFAFTMYQHFGLSFAGCEDLYLENNNVYVTGGMGIHFSGGRNIYMNRTNFRIKDGSERIMTCTADIVHSVSVADDLKITNCILEASHDDALNIKSWYCKVSEVSGASRTLTLTQTQSEVATKFDVGDKIVVFNEKDMGIEDEFTILECEKMGSTYTVKVDHRPSPSIEGCFAGNDTKATHLYLHNCLIQHKRNRGILLQCRYSEISNCCFRNVVMGPIQALGVRDSFGEAIVPSHVVIKNNKFINNEGIDINVFCYGSTGTARPNTIINFDIYNNYIFNSHGAVMRFMGLGDCKVHDNMIHFSRNLMNTLGVIYYSTNVEFNHNYSSCDNGSKDFDFMAEDVGCSNITYKDNKFLGAVK